MGDTGGQGSQVYKGRRSKIALMEVAQRRKAGRDGSVFSEKKKRSGRHKQRQQGAGPRKESTVMRTHKQ